jgi:hypothetical protein
MPPTEKEESYVPNLAYDIWFEQDQAILSAILSLLSSEVLRQCLFLKTSKEIWNKLHNLYATQSRASAIQICMQLATLEKQDLPALDYFHRVKNLTDSLAVAGAPLHEDEIVTDLLTSLPKEYDSLMTLVRPRVESLLLSEVYANLLSFEMHLVSRKGAPSHAGGPAMNYDSRGGHRG